MAYSCVRVQFEIGHEASIRNKRTVEGFTHDWEVFVRGVDNADIHHFIDKVVFHLHDTFPKPKRTVKDPPYCVKESGYAGFPLPIDIYFKTKDENRKVRFYYDLTLQPSGPPICNKVREKADFTNPTEDFRRKLIKGGGIGIGSDGGMLVPDRSGNSNVIISTEEKKSPIPSKPKVNVTGEGVKKHKNKDLLKPEEVKGNNSFAALFGTPIKTIKHSPTSSKPSSIKPMPLEPKITHEKQVKEVTKYKHSPHKEKDREKEGSSRKEKDPDRSSSKEKDRGKDKESHREKDKSKEKLAKKSNSPPPSKIKEENLKKIPDDIKEKVVAKSESIKVEKKHKDKKNRDEKEKKERHKEHHDKKGMDKDKKDDKVEKKLEIKESKDIFKAKVSSSRDEKKMKHVDKEKERNSDFEKQRHKHKKKHKEEEKERHKKKEMEKMPEVVKVKPKSPSPIVVPPPPPLPPPPPPQPTPKATIHPLNMLLQELPDKDSDSDLSNDDDLKYEPPVESASITKHKIEDKKSEMKEEKPKKREKKSKDEEREARKRKKRAKDKDEPTEKSYKLEVKEDRSDKSPSSIREDSRSPSPETQFTDAYVTQLKDLQHKIMTLQDNADLQRVVQVISETGQFEITQRTFDFDLCALDRSTVKRLQDMFIAAS